MVKATISVDYIGKSTETKPVDVPEGSVFYEVDTKMKYILCDGEWWQML